MFSPRLLRRATCVVVLPAASLLAACSSNKVATPDTIIVVDTTATAAISSAPVTTGVAGTESTVPSTEVTTSTVPPTTTEPPAPAVATTCPAEDGSSPKKKAFAAEPPMCIDAAKKYTVTMETTKGTMTFVLDPKRAPKTVNSFVTLARYHYFDGIIFHRIIKDFVIQGGDPQGSGLGGPGYQFADELPDQGEYKVGTLAMANAGPNTNGSQFFIITGAQGAALPPSYSLFGQMTSGDDVMKTLNETKTADGDRPVEEVSMTKVSIAEE
jgi:cyclophilin family peptidyl-prolyl cis-trans isomerase